MSETNQRNKATAKVFWDRADTRPVDDILGGAQLRKAPKACCAPSRQDTRDEAAPESANILPAGPSGADVQAVKIPGETAYVGTQVPGFPNDGEDPLRRKKIAAFRIGERAVTN